MPIDWWHGWADTWAELVTVIPVRKVSALGCVGSPIVSGAGASMQRTLNPPNNDDQDDYKEQGYGKVFANDNRFQRMRCRQESAGNVLMTFALEDAQHLQVSRQALHACNARHLHRFGRGCPGGCHRRFEGWRLTSPPLPCALAGARLCLHRLNMAAMPAAA